MQICLDTLKNIDGYTYEEALKSVRQGWSNLIYTLFSTIEKTEGLKVCITQIKQKFGSLRVYLDVVEIPSYLTECKGNTPFPLLFDPKTASLLSTLVSSIEELSMITCEECGAFGTQQNVRGWVQTLCPLCLAKEESV